MRTSKPFVPNDAYFALLVGKFIFQKTQYVVDKFWSALCRPVGIFLCAFILCAKFYTKVLYLLIQFLLLLPVSKC